MPFVNLNDNIQFVIGIDFGHGETSAAIARLDSNEVTDLDVGDGAKSIPSVILIRTYKGIKETAIGREAIAQFREEYNSQTDIFKCSFKKIPSEMNDEDREIMRAFFRAVYSTVLSKSQNLYNELTQDNHCVVIACPSNTRKWNKSEMEEYVAIASDAGLPIVRYSSNILFDYTITGIVRESRAAYIKLQTDRDVQTSVKANIVHGGALAIDFGSSTVDLTYYNPQDTKPVDYGTIRDLGAQKVELLIYDFLSNQYEILNEIRAVVVNKNVNHPYYDTYSNAYTYILLSIREQKEKYYKCGAKYVLRIEIDLYDATRGLLNESRIFRINSHDFSTLLANYSSEIRKDFTYFKHSYIDGKDVSMLILTGGASRMGFVKEIAEEVFCPLVTKCDNDPELTISHGVAVVGKADIRVARMLEELLSKDEIRNASIWAQVKEKIAESISSDIIRDMNFRYSKLRDGEIKTINAVSGEINDYISRIAYAQFINAAYSGVLTAYINDKVHQRILTIMSQFFPTAPQDRISKVNANNQFSVNIGTGYINTINSAIATSVQQIEEKFIEFTLKTIFNIAVLAGDGVVKVVDTAYSIAESGVRKVWVALGGKKWDKIYGNYKFGDLSNKVAINYKDEYTELSTSERLDVYNGFVSKKDEYKRNLEQDIKTALGDDLKYGIDNKARETIIEYILSSISKVRLLFN